jgi:membrane protein YqaA with SNARE-associated domain
VVTPFLPGDSLIFAIGAFANKGDLNFLFIMTLLIIAAISGNTVNYFIGRTIGERVKNSRFIKKEYLERTDAFYEKHGGKAIIISRFIPIIRTFVPFVAGVGKMNFVKFISFNIIDTGVQKLKVITPKECNRIAADNISQYPDAIKITALYAAIKKLTPFLIITAFILTNVLLRYTDMRNLILNYLGLHGLPSLLGSLLVVIFGLLIFFVMTVIHEFIHLLGYLKDFNSCYLVLSKKAVSVYNSKWVSKVNQLITLILPLMFFLLVALFISILTNNIYLFYWITLFNLGGTCSDIVVFFVTLFKTPKNSLILGHYYRIP